MLIMMMWIWPDANDDDDDACDDDDDDVEIAG